MLYEEWVMGCNESILKILRGSSRPVGASYIKRELKKFGEEVSEATIGRVLFCLDSEGYTRKEGYRGRVITSLGGEYLDTKEREEQIRRRSEIFLSALDINEIDELLEALEARKVVESQIAKYAARRCNLQAKKDLQVIIESHERRLRGLTAYQYNVPFHKYIASLCRNRILEHMLELVIDDTRFTPMLKRIEKGLGEKTLEEHKVIAQAVVERDEAAAEKAMARHIESLIDQVKRYRNYQSGGI